MPATESQTSRPRSSAPGTAVNFSRPRAPAPPKDPHRNSASYVGHVSSFEPGDHVDQSLLPVELPAEVPASRVSWPVAELPADVPARPVLAEAAVKEGVPIQPRDPLGSQPPETIQTPAGYFSRSAHDFHPTDPARIRSTDQSTLEPQPHDHQSNQRHVPCPRSAAGNTASTTDTHRDEPPSPAPSTFATLLPPDGRPQIVRRVSVTQTSERLSTSSDRSTLEPDISSYLGNHFIPAEEATGVSRPPPAPSTSSGSGSGSGSGSASAPEKWTSSNYDTSGLSAAQLAKLTRKGINPALYAEMKAARKGRGKMSPLVGNTFLG